MGVGIGHSLLAYKSTLQGMGKLQVFSATWASGINGILCQDGGIAFLLVVEAGKQSQNFI